MNKHDENKCTLVMYIIHVHNLIFQNIRTRKKNLYPTANVLALNFFYIVSYLKTHGDAQTNDLQNIDFFYRFLHILYLVSKDEKMNF